ncbi:MAG: hypothetical protein JRH14_01490 [Deltaproteobacteria bacterium]|nr:hypothetical protein [Deltaproteobacteria bacterium]MBW2158627.1 hypothetical protein [Deltaproteobacteria bacterium]MBW2374770.1 hypothetical protein [Deltaproteobacteria bacterium]
MGLRLMPLFVVAMIASCNPAADYALVGSAYVPGAHGDIQIEKIDKEQILISATLDHLVPPEKIELGLTHYIVWFTPVGEHPIRQRALDYDAETQVGRVSIPTSLREFDFQVTAENGETPNQPSDLLVASQKIREN